MTTTTTTTDFLDTYEGSEKGTIRCVFEGKEITISHRDAISLVYELVGTINELGTIEEKSALSSLLAEAEEANA